MRKLRNIISIDEEKCTGCGQCVLDCAEGALQIIDGKAKLVGEIYCDGLGACLSGCPTGALTVTQREADDFDEQAVEELLKTQGRPVPPPPGQAHGHHGHDHGHHHHDHGHGHHHHGHGHHGHHHAGGGCPGAAAMSLKPAEPATLAQGATLACGCPSSSATALTPAAAPASGAAPAVSTLGHFPIKLALLSPQAPFLQNADLLLLADCAAAALPDLHARLLPGKAVALACPKLDDAQAHIRKLAALLSQTRPKSVTVAIMEVPCCKGLQFIASQALQMAGLNLPVQTIVVSRDGKVLDQAGAAGLALA